MEEEEFESQLMAERYYMIDEDESNNSCCWQVKCANSSAGCRKVVILGSSSVEPLVFGKQRTLKK
jgi:hypothetical protein